MAKMEELERRAKMPQGCTWYLGSDFPFLAFLAMQCGLLVHQYGVLAREVPTAAM